MKLVVVGIVRFKDSPAVLITGNLARFKHVRISAWVIEIFLNVRGLVGVKGTDCTRVLDDNLQLVKRFTQRIDAVAQSEEAVLVPAVAESKPEIFQNFAAQVNHPVAEVPTSPPCVAGRRLNDILVDLLTEAHVNMCNDATVTGVTSVDGVITTVTVARVGGSDSVKVGAVAGVVGRFTSGNLTRGLYVAFYEATLESPFFILPAAEKMGIHSIDIRRKILTEQLLSSGIMVSEKMQALRPATKDSEFDALAFENLYMIGEVLDGTSPTSEISGKGLALGPIFRACEAINVGKGELR